MRLNALFWVSWQKNNSQISWSTVIFIVWFLHTIFLLQTTCVPFLHTILGLPLPPYSTLQCPWALFFWSVSQRKLERTLGKQLKLMWPNQQNWFQISKTLKSHNCTVIWIRDSTKHLFLRQVRFYSILPNQFL